MAARVFFLSFSQSWDWQKNNTTASVSRKGKPFKCVSSLPSVIPNNLLNDASCLVTHPTASSTTVWTLGETRSPLHLQQPGSLGRQTHVGTRSHGNRRVESEPREARISPPSRALALSDIVTLIGGRGEGVTAPACLGKSSRLGYDKNSAVNHSLQSFYVCGWCIVNELKIRQWELGALYTSAPKCSALACAHTSIPLLTCKRGLCLLHTPKDKIRNVSKANRG